MSEYSTDKDLAWSMLERYLQTLGFDDVSAFRGDVIELEASGNKQLIFEVLERGLLISVIKEVAAYQLAEVVKPAMAMCHYREFLPVPICVGMGKNDQLAFSCLLSIGGDFLEVINPAVDILLSLHDKLDIA
ncbi:hypothetical protein SG34_015295 [Thalassomonas viridans]|uniref:Type III secretion chaperone SycN n=1 Tax=Thalassomonas viridans TaxID=137584 RepID=A0AAE9YYR2_9GAMM|nr:hypothetical protein [Thalassomonas viridans]WDE02809.1 hypothetical protein SG34_015295 [Thalassomonas viridans]